MCWLACLLTWVGAGAGGCGGSQASAPAEQGEATSAAKPSTPEQVAQAEAERKQAIDRDFPRHGLVTGVQIKLRKKPDPDATVIGYVRVGARIRLGRDAIKAKNCASGFYPIHPTGYVCAGEGVEVADAPPDSPLALTPPAKDAPLPYAYYFVKEPKVPEYHRLPSRDEQREVRDFVARYDALFGKSPERALKLLTGELTGEPPVPSVVRRFLDRGFFVAGAGLEERASRKFVRTVRGSYVKLSQLETRSGSSFSGVELGAEHSLPIAWAVREVQPFAIKPREDGTLRLIPIEGSTPHTRLSIVPWLARERIGDTLFHKLGDGLYVKSWFLAVAERIARPKEIPKGSPWVHVNLEQQTLVAYQGDAPVYATLVSSGLPDHATPIGLFQIRQKYVANGMSDLGPEAGDDRYSIDDVPWTQYFSGSIALHGAFWHERFGLQRSHGCVNLAPKDAHRVFEHTWPMLGEGWHGASTDKTGLPASYVLITQGIRDEDLQAAISPPEPVADAPLEGAAEGEASAAEPKPAATAVSAPAPAARLPAPAPEPAPEPKESP